MKYISFSFSLLRVARIQSQSQFQVQGSTTCTRSTFNQTRKYAKQPNMAAVVDTVKSTIAENFGGPSHSLAKKEHQFSLDEVPDLSGKVAVITGGAAGIGYGCSHTLLSHNIAKLFIISRTQAGFDEALKAIVEDLGEEKAKKLLGSNVTLVIGRLLRRLRRRSQSARRDLIS